MFLGTTGINHWEEAYLVAWAVIILAAVPLIVGAIKASKREVINIQYYPCPVLGNSLSFGDLDSSRINKRHFSDSYSNRNVS